MALASLCFLSFVACVASDDVVSLTTKTFDAHLSANKQTLIDFYAPWCGHCKKLAPEFEKAAGELKLKNIVLAMVDATEEKDVAKKYDVKGFPTLLWFEDGKNIDYDGGRTADGIVDWVSAMVGAAVIVTTSPPDAGEKPRVVLYGDKISDQFEAVAKQSRRKAAFYFVKEGGSSKVVLSHKNEAPLELTNVASQASIDEFVKENSLPFFGSLDGDTFDIYMGQEKGLIWSMFDSEGMSAQELDSSNRGMMTEVAKKHRSKYLATYTDTEKFKEAIQNMLGVDKFPAIAVQKKAGDKKRYVHTGSMTTSAISDFITNVDAGQVQPFLRSEAEPANDPNAKVRYVVSTNFKREVFTQDKDVLLQVYAPWCGHCKKLEPEYERLADKIAEAKLSDFIRIAKIDGTANDSPDDGFDWTSFPTLYFVKEKQTTPLAFEGERTFKGMLKFIKKHATKVDEVRARLEPKKKRDEEL